MMAMSSWAEETFRCSCVRLAWVMSASTWATSLWMFAGRLPTPAAACSTAAASASVVAVKGAIFAFCLLALVFEGESSRASSRSFWRAFTQTMSVWLRAASFDTREYCDAFPSADATHRPPKTTPMSRAATMTAKNRRATGQPDTSKIGRRADGSTLADSAGRPPAGSARERTLAAP